MALNWLGLLSARTTPRSALAAGLAKLGTLTALLIYALVAIGMRIVMARVFFLSGQVKIEGPEIPIAGFGRDFNFSVVLPAAVKDTTFRMFETQFAALPMPSTIAAYLYSYAEFVLPICLIIGFATRLAALGLVVLTALMSVYVMPAAFWSSHAYWIVILMVLVSVGPGALSIDALMRFPRRP